MYIRLTVKSQMLMRATDVHVFLPCHDGYPDAKAPYPTLYFLPGYSASAEELATCLPLRQMSALFGMAVVIPEGENSFYTDHPERATQHGRYVGDELVEITRTLLPSLSHQPQNTFIGGISMGGYGAAVLGLQRPDTFSRIAMLSPAIEPDRLFEKTGEGAVPSTLFDALFGGAERYAASLLNPRNAIAALKKSGKNLPRLYMCCGRQDWLVRDACLSFRDFLQEEGVPLCYEEGDGQHDIPYWDDRLESCFRFLRA